MKVLFPICAHEFAQDNVCAHVSECGLRYCLAIVIVYESFYLTPHICSCALAFFMHKSEKDVIVVSHCKPQFSENKCKRWESVLTSKHVKSFIGTGAMQ